MTVTAVPAASHRAEPKRRPGLMPVLTATLRETQSLFGAACGYIVLIGLLVGLLLPAFKTLNLQGYLTGSIGALFGGSTPAPGTTLFAVYMALELYGSFFMLLFGGVTAYAAGAAIARNIEDGTIDLTLARPVGRTRFYLEKWLAILIGSLLIVATAILTTWIATRIFQHASLLWVPFLEANLDVGAILFVIAAMGMLVSSALSAARAAGGAAVLVVVFWYFCQTFGTAGDRLTFLKYLGPYYYAPSSQVILSGQWTDPWKLLVPVGAGLLLAIAGLIQFRRRDLTA